MCELWEGLEFWLSRWQGTLLIQQIVATTGQIRSGLHRPAAFSHRCQCYQLPPLFSVLCNVTPCHSLPSSCFPKLGYTALLNKVFFDAVSGGLPLGLDLFPLTPTSSVRWQMLRLIIDYVPARLHQWSWATPDCLPSATELFRSPLLVSGAVCLNMSLPHLLWLSCGLVSRHICLIPTPCDCTVPAQWRSLLSDTIIVLGTYLLTWLPQIDSSGESFFLHT